LDKLLGFMRSLESRGNLRVPLPESSSRLQEILINGGYMHENGKVDASDWQALIQDFVRDASDFQGATIQKMLIDMRDAQDALHDLRNRVDEFTTRGEDQFDELIAVLRRIGAEAAAETQLERAPKGHAAASGGSEGVDGAAIAVPMVQAALSRAEGRENPFSA